MFFHCPLTPGLSIKRLILINHLNSTELDYPVKIKPHRRYYTCPNFWHKVLLKITFVLDIDLLTLRMTSNHQSQRKKQSSFKIIRKKVGTHVLAVFVENHISFTLKLTFRPTRWPSIIKIVSGIDYLVKYQTKDVLHFFLLCFLTIIFFTFLTLELTSRPSIWPLITKIILLMIFSNKMARKRGITHVPSFIC